MSEIGTQRGNTQENSRSVHISLEMAEFLDQYSTEVLKAALNILRARSKKKTDHGENPNSP